VTRGAEAEAEALQPWPDSLTRRERQIAELVCAGRGRGEVAELLGFNPKTFDTHRLRLMHKLNVRNEVQLVRLALQRGWVR